MESRVSKAPFFVRPACSFEPSLHPHFDTIRAECEPWILSLVAPASPAASHFWLASSFPLLIGLVHAHCTATHRVILLTKLFAWFFVCDSDDDDPFARGCESSELLSARHELLLACYAGQLRQYADRNAPSDGTVTAPEITPRMAGATVLPCSTADHGATDADHIMHKITKGLDALHDIWKDISKDMSPKMLSRYLQATRDHLNGNKLQAYYRKSGRLPGIEEYIYGLRRPTSLLMACFVLMEYGLGIELDDEVLASETVMRLQDAVADHVALVNDVFSCEAEKSIGDYFNLPCVILQERKAAQPEFEFVDAMRESLSMIEEVDEMCVQLIKEVEGCKLIEKAGVRAYLRGLESWMAGNLDWSLKTARYSHTCSAQGVVSTVQETSPPRSIA